MNHLSKETARRSSPRVGGEKGDGLRDLRDLRGPADEVCVAIAKAREAERGGSEVNLLSTQLRRTGSYERLGNPPQGAMDGACPYSSSMARRTGTHIVID